MILKQRWLNIKKYIKFLTVSFVFIEVALLSLKCLMSMVSVDYNTELVEMSSDKIAITDVLEDDSIVLENGSVLDSKDIKSYIKVAPTCSEYYILGIDGMTVKYAVTSLVFNGVVFLTFIGVSMYLLYLMYKNSFKGKLRWLFKVGYWCLFGICSVFILYIDYLYISLMCR